MNMVIMIFSTTGKPGNQPGRAGTESSFSSCKVLRMLEFSGTLSARQGMVQQGGLLYTNLHPAPIIR